MQPRARIMFVTSNGTGLGHLTRSMAIARRLDPAVEPLFFTLSRAAPIVREVGFAVEYMASHGSPGAGSDWRWSRRLGARLGAAIEEADPRVLVFDGILPYDPLLASMRRVPWTVWCRRALWRADASTAPLTRSDLFDAVLEPGEFASSAETGPTSARRHEAHVVAPIVFCDDEELLPRTEAERELGLEAGKVTVLVQLGQGPDVEPATRRCLSALADRGDVQVAAASSTIAGLLDVPEGIVHVRSTYPMSRYYAAFDAVVSAAGYNAFHELVRFRVPSLFVPMRRETDDQQARARYAELSGVGTAVEGPSDPGLEESLAVLLDPDRRRAMRDRLGELRPANGAHDAALWLEQMVGRPARPGSGPRRSLRARAPRAWVFLRTLPRTVVRLVWQTVSAPRPRTLVLALAAGDDELERGIHAALEQTPDTAERVLLVTDSLTIGAIWRLGVGIEHMPGAGERQAAVAGTDYGHFLRRRLGLILAWRPRFRRTLGVGKVPEDLLTASRASPRRRNRLLD